MHNVRYDTNTLLDFTAFSPQNGEKGRLKKLSRVVTVSIYPLLAGLLAACSSGKYGEYIPDTPFNAVVVDGITEGSRVFIDQNGDGVFTQGVDIDLGLTDASGVVSVPGQYAGRMLSADVWGATDLSTGVALGAGVYTATVSPSGDVVLSPITTAIVEAIKQGLTAEETLEKIFGENTSITVDDVKNLESYVISETEVMDNMENNYVSDKVAQASIGLQVLLEQSSGNSGIFIRSVVDEGGFKVEEDLSQTLQSEVSGRIGDAREQRMLGIPVVVTKDLMTQENLDLPLEESDWGFRDPEGNVSASIPSVLTQIRLVSITDGTTSVVRGKFVETGSTNEYEMPSSGVTMIPMSALSALVFEPATDYIGVVVVSYYVWDGEQQSKLANLDILVVPPAGSSPVFVSSLSADVYETATEGTIVYRARAIAVENVTYSLDDTNFTIDSATGFVTSNIDLDQEAMGQSMYTLVITASITAEGSTTPMSSSMTVTLNVEDLNDAPPEFTSIGDVGINENIADDSAVYTAIAMPDISGASVVYSLVDTATNDGASFNINANTGTVTISTSPDHEMKPSYSFTVEAKVGNQSAQRNVQVAVIDLNDNDPSFTSSMTAMVDEDDDVDNNMVYTAVAVPDVTGSDPVYSLLSTNDGALFTIHSDTGVVTTLSALDYEARSSYSFTVRATVDYSGNSLSDDRDVTLTVRDVNEPPTVLNTVADFSAPRGLTTSFSAIFANVFVDEDANDMVAITLSMQNGSPLPSGIQYDPMTDVLTVDTTVALGAYDLVAMGTDIAGMSGDENFTLTVEPPMAPTFTGEINVSVNEDRASNSVLYTFSATPSIAGQPVTYSLRPYTSNSLFAIDPNTGALTLVSLLNHESEESVTLTIDATSSGVSASQYFTVNVVDINDDPPVFTSGGTGSVRENLGVSAVVSYTAVATPDVSGSSVVYSLVDTTTNDGTLFTINANTGVVTSNNDLDYEMKSSYSLTIRASVVHGNMTQTANRIVTIAVVDENDPPEVSTSGTQNTLNEGAYATRFQTGIRIEIADEDVPSDSFSFGVSDSRFEVYDYGMYYGLCVVAGATIDYDEMRTELTVSTTMTITVTDMNDSNSTDSVNVTLIITDVNDESPVFATTSATTYNIDENNDVDDVIHTAVATPDVTGATVVYSLKTGTGNLDSDSFTIDPVTGEVKSTISFDYEATPTKTTYMFVTVATVGTQSSEQTVTLNVGDLVETPFEFTSVTTVDVNENISTATAVHTVVASVIADSTQAVTLSLNNTGDASDFSFNATTGVLTFVNIPDFEATPAKTSYTVMFRVAAMIGGMSEFLDQTVVISLLDVNEDPVLLAPVITDNDSSVVEDDTEANRTVSGTLTVSDVDGNDPINALQLRVKNHTTTDNADPTDQTPALVFTNGVAVFETIYGDITFIQPIALSSDTMTWTYVLDDSDTTTNALASGATATDTVKFLVTDVAGETTSVQEISVTITGANDAPVENTGSDAIADQVMIVEMSDTYTFSASAFTDPEGDVITYSAYSTGMTAGNFVSGISFNATTRTFSFASTAASGTTVAILPIADYGITLVASDGSDMTTRAFTLTIRSPNDFPVIDSSASDLTGSVTEDTPGEMLTGMIVATDTDGTIMSYAIGTSSYSTATIDATGAWTYELDNTNTNVGSLDSGATLTDTITVTVTDNLGGETMADITITINGRTDIVGTGSGDSSLGGGSSATDSQVIQGGLGVDTITAGSGGDVIVGGFDNDTITLGTGADTLVYRFSSYRAAVDVLDNMGNVTGTIPAVTDAFIGYDGGDVIYEFDRGVDRLVLFDVAASSTVDTATFLSGLITGDDNKAVIQIYLERDGTDYYLDSMKIFFAVAGLKDGVTIDEQANQELIIYFKDDSRQSIDSTDFMPDILAIFGTSDNYSVASKELADPTLTFSSGVNVFQSLLGGTSTFDPFDVFPSGTDANVDVL